MGEAVKNIHFICKRGENHANIEGRTFRTGSWSVSDKEAEKLVGGMIYLHETQKDKAWTGGKILRYHVHESGPDKGRKVFIYQQAVDFRVVCPGPWGQEKCILSNQ